MPSQLSFAALLLLLCCTGAVAGRELQQVKYASIYDAVSKLPELTTLKFLIDAAGLKAALSNPTLKYTLLAPDNNAWNTMFVECLDPTKLVGVNAPPACSLHALLASPAKLQQLLKYHLISAPVRVQPGANWPTKAFKVVKTVQGTIMRLRTFRSFYEAHGTGRDSMLYGGAKANLAAGQALVHVAASVVSIAPPGTA